MIRHYCCSNSKKSNPRRRGIFLLCLLLALVSVAACTPARSQFEPEELPDERINSALVRTPSPIYRDGKDLIIIKTIDGVPPTFHQDKAIVSPGLHTFQVGLEFHHDDKVEKAKRYITKADVSLEFEVEADGEYLIDAYEDDSGVWLWALDLATNIVVAGKRPLGVAPKKAVAPIWKK